MYFCKTNKNLWKAFLISDIKLTTSDICQVSRGKSVQDYILKRKYRPREEHQAEKKLKSNMDVFRSC